MKTESVDSKEGYDDGIKTNGEAGSRVYVFSQAIEWYGFKTLVVAR